MNLQKIKGTIKTREFSNSFWNVLDVIILPLLMLAATPFFIYKLGPEHYGIWMLVNSIIASIGIFNVGIGDATIKFVSKYKALDDDTNLYRIVNTGFSINLVIIFVIMVAGLLVSHFVSIYNIFNLSAGNEKLASTVIILGAAVFGIKQMEQLALSLFKGLERYDTSSKISMTSKFFLLGGQVLIVYLGYKLVQVFTVSVFVSAGAVVLELIFIKFRFRKISFIPHFNKVSVKEVFSFSSWSWVQSVLSVIASQVDRFIVITFAGPKFLAYYALAATVGGQLHNVFTAAASWVFPKVSAKTERKENAARLYYTMQHLMIFAGIVIISVLIIFDKIIFKTWLGQETYVNSILLIKLFLFLTLFNMMSIIPHYFLLGSNLIKISTYFMFMSVVFTIGFMIICYYWIGITGLAYGKILSSFLAIPIMLTYVHYKLVDRRKLSGLIIFIPAALISSALYLKNEISIPLAIVAVLLFWQQHRKKSAEYNLKTNLNSE